MRHRVDISVKAPSGMERIAERRRTILNLLPRCPLLFLSLAVIACQPGLHAAGLDPITNLGFSDIRVIYDDNNAYPGVAPPDDANLMHRTWQSGAWSDPKDLTPDAELGGSPDTFTVIPGHHLRDIYHVVHRVNPQDKEELMAIQAFREEDDSIRVYVFRRASNEADGQWQPLFNTFASTAGGSDEGIVRNNKGFVRAFDLAYEQRSGKAVMVAAMQYEGTVAKKHNLKYWIIDHGVVTDKSGTEATLNADGTTSLAGWPISVPAETDSGHYVDWVVLASRPRLDQIFMAWECDKGELGSAIWSGSSSTSPNWTDLGLLVKKPSKLSLVGSQAFSYTVPFDMAITSNMALIVYAMHTPVPCVGCKQESYLRYRVMNLSTSSNWGQEISMSRRLYEDSSWTSSWKFSPGLVTLATEPDGERIAMASYTFATSTSAPAEPHRVYVGIWDCTHANATWQDQANIQDPANPTDRSWADSCWIRFDGYQTSFVTSRLETLTGTDVLDMYLVTYSNLRATQPKGSFPVGIAWVGSGPDARAVATYSKNHAGGQGTIDWVLWDGNKAWAEHHSNSIEATGDEETNYLLATLPNKAQVAVIFSVKDSGGKDRIRAAFYNHGKYDPANPDKVWEDTPLTSLSNELSAVDGRPYSFAVNLGFPKFYSGGLVDPDKAENQVFGYQSGIVTIKPITIKDPAGLIRGDRNLYIRVPPTLSARWASGTCGTASSAITVSGNAASKIAGTVCAQLDPDPALPDRTDKQLKIEVTSNFLASDTVIISGLKLKDLNAVSSGPLRFELDFDSTSEGVVLGTDVQDEGTMRIAERVLIENHLGGPATNAFALATVPGAVADAELLKFRLSPKGAPVVLTGLTFQLPSRTGISSAELNSNPAKFILTYSGGASGSISAVAYDATPSAFPNPYIAASFSPPVTLTHLTPTDFVLKDDVPALAVGDGLTIELQVNGVQAEGTTGSPLLKTPNPPTGEGNLTYWGTVVLNGLLPETHGVASYQTVVVPSNPMLINADLPLSWSPINATTPTKYEISRDGGTSWIASGDFTNTGTCVTTPPLPALAACVSKSTGLLSSAHATKQVTDNAVIRLTGQTAGTTDELKSVPSASFKVAGKLSILNPGTQALNALTQVPGPMPKKDLFKFLVASEGENVNLGPTGAIALSFTSSGGGVSLADLDQNDLELWEGLPGQTPSTNIASGSIAGEIVKAGTTTGTITINKSFLILQGIGLKEYTLRGTVSNLAANDDMTLGDTVTVGSPVGATSGVPLDTPSFAGAGVVESVTGKTHKASTYAISLVGLNAGSAIAVGQPLGISWVNENMSNPTAVDYTVNNGSGWSSVLGCNLSQSPCSWTLPATTVSPPGQANIRLTGTEAMDGQSLTVNALPFPAFTIVGTLALGSPSGGQAQNLFVSTPPVTGDLFRFKLTATGESVTLSGLTLTLSNLPGTTGITPSTDLSGLQLLLGGSPVGGAPTITGTQLQFTSPITVPLGAQDFILKGTVNNLVMGKSVTVSLDTSGLMAPAGANPKGTISNVDLTTVSGAVSGATLSAMHTLKGYAVTLTPNPSAYKVGDVVQVGWSKVPSSGDMPDDSVNVDYLVGATDSGDCGAHPTGASPVVTSCNFTLPATATALNAAKFQVADASVSSSAGASGTFTVTGTLALGPHGAGQTPNAFTTYPTVTNADLFLFRLTAVAEQVDLSTLTFTWSGTGVAQSELQNLKLFRGGTQVGGVPTVSASTITFNAINVPKGAQDFVLRGDVSNLSPTGDSLTVGLAATNFGSPTGVTSTIDLTTVVGAISGSLLDMIHTVKGYTVTMTPAQPAYKIGDAVQLDWLKVPPSGPIAPGDSVNVDYFVGATDSDDCGARPTGSSPVVTSCTFTLPNTATALNNGKFQVQDAAVATSTGSTSAFTVTGTMTLGEHGSGQPGNAFVVLPTATNADLYRFKLTAAGEPVTLTSIIFDAAFLGIDPSDITALTLIKDGVPVSAAFAVNANNIAASLTGATINGASSFVLRGTVANLIAGDEVTFSLNPTTDIQATGVTSSMDLTTVPGALAGSVNSMQHIAKSYMIDAPAANEMLGVGQTGYVVRWTPKGGAGTTVKIYFAKDGTTFGTPIATVSGSSWTWTPSVPDAITAIARLKIEDSTNSTIFGISAPFTIAGQVIVDAPTAGNIWKAGNPHDIKWHTVGTYGTVRIEWTGEAGTPPYSAWTVLGTVPASTGSFTWMTQDADATPPTGNTKIRVVDGDTSGTHPPTQTESAAFKLARLKMIAPITTVAGETFWTIGSTQNIQWDAMGLDTVQLLYATTPDFASPIQLNGGTPVAASAGTLSWTIPNTPAAQARVRIYDPVSGILTESDPFHIAATFTLLQPTAGATGQVGQPVAIAWTTDAGTVPQVLIQVSSDDFATVRPDSPGLVNNVSPLTPAWVPAAAGANTKIRICDARDINVCVTSAPVRISGLAIESPSSGNRLVVGSPWTIRWNFDGAFSSVKIELLDQSKNVIKTITPGTSVGAAGVGTYNWSGPSLTDIGQIRYLRVSDTAGSTSADSAAFSIGAPFDFINPAASSVIWGVGEQRQIQWSPSVTDDPAVTKVTLEYWNGTAYVPVVATDGTTGVFNNTGSVTWPVADLPGLLGNPQATPTQPFTLRISDATPGHVLDATHTSPQATASYYRIDWEVRDAVPPSKLLSFLSVDDTSGWKVGDFSLNGQNSRYYPYGTFSTIWSVKDTGGVTSQGTDEGWLPTVDQQNNPVTICASDLSLVGCQTRVVKIETLSSEAIVWKVNTESAYQPGANLVSASDDQIEFSSWLEKSGKLINDLDPKEPSLIESGKIDIFDAGVLIRTLPNPAGPVTLPDISGLFRFVWDLKDASGNVVADGKTYFTKTTIKRNGRDFTSGGALNVTIPKKILTGGTGSGGGGITVADLTTALDPIKTATVGPASTLQQIKDGVGTIGVNQLPLVQAVNDIHAATVGDPLNANDSKLDQIHNELTRAGGTGTPTVRDLVTQTNTEVTGLTPTGDLASNSLKQRVIAIMEGEDPSVTDGFRGLRQFQADVNDHTKALRRGGILNRDMEVELGEGALIQYRAEGGVPTLSVYDALGNPMSAPALTLSATTGVYESTLSFTALGEYRVVVSEPASADSGGTLDSITIDVRAATANQDVGMISATLDDLVSRVSGLEASVQALTANTATIQATSDETKTIADQLAADAKTILEQTDVSAEEAASQLEQLDTTALTVRLDELKRMVDSAQGSSAAVGLSQSAYSAASEAVKILQELQTQLRTGGGAGNAQLLLGQLGEKLNTVSTSVTVIPGKMSAEELSAQLKELAKKASGVATEKGYHFDSLYEIAEAQSGDVQTVRNQVEELKTLLEMQRAILEQKVNQPVMKSWFEAN